MTTLFAIVRKDLKLFLSDRRALIMSFAVPIAIASFFGFVFSGQGGSNRGKITIHVIDHDGSDISKKIVSDLSADKSFTVLTGTEAEARRAVQRGTSTVAVVIPQNFGLASARSFFGPNPKPRLQFLYDPSHQAELGMVRGLLTEYIMKDVSEQAFAGPMSRQITAESLRDLEGATGMAEQDRATLRALLQSVDQLNARTASGSSGLRPPGMSLPYEIAEEAVTARRGETYNPYAQAFAGMGVQSVLFAAIDAAVLLLLERQRGLWSRVRSAPLSRLTLLGGKAISSSLIACATLIVLFTFGAIVFRIRILGSLPGFLAVVAACALMASTFGLLIAAVGKTPQATRGVAIFATLVLVMLGGAWMPSFLFPAWLQQATLFVPTRWAVDGLQTMSWRGLGLSSALPSVAALCGFAALFGSIAALRFRWE
jgi:linearmycin/streptolysin S transport system permease protein